MSNDEHMRMMIGLQAHVQRLAGESCSSLPVEARDARIADLILEQQVMIPAFRTIIMGGCMA
jgi:hypothetical protein